MYRIQNPFSQSTGSDLLSRPSALISLLCVILISGLAISFFGLLAGIGLLLSLLGCAFLFFLFSYPILGLYAAVALGFILLGSARYLPDLPIGVAMDGLLILTYIALLMKRFYAKSDWAPLKKDVTFLAVVWFGYSVFELINPETVSMSAWLSGMRGVSLYMLLVIPLTLLFIDNQRKLDVIFYLWGIFSMLASFKGIFQNFRGVDMWEQAWLDQGGAVTHVIYGRLRIFSFFSDAGQFGANQAYSAVMATILMFIGKNWRQNFFFFLVALLGFYGMLLSGTRGALSVPIAGFAFYFILRKNWSIMISGFFMIVVMLIFFKFTTIGQGNQYIRRMRTAFDFNNASLQVRLENQKKLSVYLATRPFGGGIGHAGVKAQRYLPNAFLSQIPTDSWYVMIWAEQGIVGLLLHLSILFYIIGRSSYLIYYRIRDPILKRKMTALTAGMAGVMVASYGNAVLGTMPTSILIYVSMALMLNAERLDNRTEDSIKQISQ
jgi:hypothetical protein